MFGTLKPRLCVLQPDARDAWGRLYCGVCAGLGEGFGHGLRATLTHDAVFVATLADALADEAGASSSCRCPLVPVVHRATVSFESPAIRFAAAVQILLGDQWLADRAADGRRPHRLARTLLADRVRRAHEALRALGVDSAALHGFESRQGAVERTDSPSPAEAAAPTADALGHVFASLADLRGVSSEARAARATLRTFGRALGAVIYHLDALDDLRDDLVDGAFNPCLTRHAGTVATLDTARLDETVTALSVSLDALSVSLAALPMQRHRALVESVIDGTLRPSAQRAIEGAREIRDPAHLSIWRGFAARPPVSRAMVRMALALLALWTWLLHGAAGLAQPGSAPRPTTPPQGPGCHPRCNARGCDPGCDGCRALSQCGDTCARCHAPCGSCGHPCSGCSDRLGASAQCQRNLHCG